MDDILEELTNISDTELRSRLLSYDIEVGPIFKSTKTIFIKRLARLILKSRGIEFENEKESSANNTTTPSNNSENSTNNNELNNHPNTPKSPTLSDISGKHYYAVSLPSNDSDANHMNWVFSSQLAACKAARSVSGSRFKSFSSYEDALKFASTPSPVQTIFKNEEPLPTNNLPSLRKQDHNHLRNLIEGDKYEEFEKCVRANAKYLVNSTNDLPTILKEGVRYNALHVCASKDRVKFVSLIIDLIKSGTLMREMYMNSDKTFIEDKTELLLHSYINGCDGVRGDTPLHICARFNNQNVAKVLLEEECLERDRVNRLSEKAEDVIGDRQKLSKEEELKFKKLFENCFYVPILRTDDLSEPAQIGDVLQTPPRNLPSSVKSSPSLKIHAVAGPMSADNVKAFQKFCTSPLKRQIRCIDLEKGMERVCRSAAKDMQITFTEYWKFLNDFADFSTKDGLNKLENYLKQKHEYVENIHDLAKQFNTMLLNSPKSDKNDNADVDDNIFHDAETCGMCNKCTINGDSFIEDIDSTPVYLNGPEPTKLDASVFQAVEESGKDHIDLNLFPRVAFWRKNVLNYNKQLGMENWSTPKVQKGRSRNVIHLSSPE